MRKIHELFRLHKNKVEQSPGWQNPIFRWCADEAAKVCPNEQDYWGGFVIDEMKIQLSCILKLNGKYKF